MQPSVRGFSFADACSVMLLFCLLAAASVARPQTDAANVMLRQVPVSQNLPHLSLLLKRTEAQDAALRRFLVDVQMQNSGKYHAFLSPEQFREEYAPSSEVVSAARRWLTARGFEVDGLSPNGMRLQFHGSVLQFNGSFGATLRQQGAMLLGANPAMPDGLRNIAEAVSIESVSPEGSVDAASFLRQSVDANTAVVVLPASGSSQTDDAMIPDLLQEAAAQGMTVLAGEGSQSGDAVLPGTPGGLAVGTEVRPWWQRADGLPADAVRAVPDALATDRDALGLALTAMVAQRGMRVGELASSLYALRKGHGVFSHASASVNEGEWAAGEGLGTIDIQKLVHALAVGTKPGNLALSLSGTTVVHGQSLTLGFTASGSSGTPTGTVIATLKARSNGAVTTPGPASLDGNGAAAFSIRTLEGGLYDISGTTSGDSTYASTTSNTVTATVSPEAAVVTASAPSGITVGGTIPVTVVVTSSSGVGVPTGTVTVYAYGTQAASTPYTATLAAGSGASATATVSVPATDAGTFTFQANCTTGLSFSCYQPQSFSVTVGSATSKAATSTSVKVAPAAPLSGGTVTLTATVVLTVSSGSAAPTGSVSFYANGTLLTTVGVSGGSATAGTVVTASAKLPASATVLLTAVYSGDTNYATSTSPALTVTTVRNTSTLALASSAAAVNAGGSIVLTATVTPGALGTTVVPTGTVTFFETRNGVVIMLGSSTLTAGGPGTAVATLNLSGLAGGAHSYTATYAGDGSYLPATSNAVTLAVAEFALTFNPSSLTLKQGLSGNVTGTVTVSGGFSGTIAVACTPPANVQMSCSLSPATLSGNGGPVTLTVTTTAATTSAGAAALRRPGILGTASLAGLALLLSTRKRRRMAALLMFAWIVSLTSGGCSLGIVGDTSNGSGGSTGPVAGGSTTTGTPLGTYAITITAASSDTSIRHDYRYGVTVQ